MSINQPAPIYLPVLYNLTVTRVRVSVEWHEFCNLRRQNHKHREVKIVDKDWD
ncbi:hypothetical protein ACFLTK_01155 [Chloroflexota bacterium]